MAGSLAQAVAALRARQAEAHRLALLYEAERAGLAHAEHSPRVVVWSADEEQQAAFARGHADGRALLAVYGGLGERRAGDV